MTGITNTPPSPLAAQSVTVEYYLSLADYHALDLFVYYKVVRKQTAFRFHFYLGNIVYGLVAAAGAGLMVGLGHLGSTVGTPSSAGGHSSLQLGCWVGLSVLVLYLCGLIPGSYFHRYARKQYEKRARRIRQRQQQADQIGPGQRFQVVLTPEGFTEAATSHDASPSVQITKSQVTTARWSAVSGIDVTDAHVFFTIDCSTQSFTQPGFLVLPRLAFRDDAGFHAFVEAACRYRDAALQGRPGSPAHSSMSTKK